MRKTNVQKPDMRIGIVSDTHGLLRPEVLPALAGVDHLLHAGDVGDIAILDRLRQIAPVTAIRGNIDRSGPTHHLSETEAVELGGKTFYLLHDLNTLDLQPKAAGFDAVVSGHTHQALIESRNGVLYINPGSIGPRRFKQQPTLAIATIRRNKLSAEIVGLPFD